MPAEEVKKAGEQTIEGTVVLVVGFHHSGTTLIRHLLASAPGTVEFEPDSVGAGLIPCQWLGPASRAAKMQKCGRKAGTSLKPLLEQDDDAQLPIIVAKKTANEYIGLSRVLDLITQSPSTTSDTRSFGGTTVRWAVKSIVIQIRDPLDAVWSVLKREIGADKFDDTFRKRPCMVRSHFKKSWAMLRESALFAITNETTRSAVVPYDPYTNKMITSKEDCAKLSKTKMTLVARKDNPDAWCMGRARRFVTRSEVPTVDERSNMCRMQKKEAEPDLKPLFPARVVAYEDLVKDPETVMQGLCAHLQSRGVDLKYSPNMVNTTANPLQRTNVGQTFKQMSDEELAKLQTKRLAGNQQQLNAFRASQINRPIGTQRMSAWISENPEARQKVLATMNVEAAIASGVFGDASLGLPLSIKNPGGKHALCTGAVTLDTQQLTHEQLVEISQHSYGHFKQSATSGVMPISCLS